MKKLFIIVLGILTAVLPLVSIAITASGNGWLSVKVIGLWTIAACIYAVKG